RGKAFRNCWPEKVETVRQSDCCFYNLLLQHRNNQCYKDGHLFLLKPLLKISRRRCLLPAHSYLSGLLYPNWFVQKNVLCSKSTVRFLYQFAFSETYSIESQNWPCNYHWEQNGEHHSQLESYF